MMSCLTGQRQALPEKPRGHAMAPQSKTWTWAGWIIAGLISGLMVFSATMKFVAPPEVAEQMVSKFGYSTDVMFVIGIVELSCVVIYLIPQTAMLGAVLLTGYLGGAVATHVRVHDNFLIPALVGMLAWLALYLRDPYVRARLPYRQRLAQPESPARYGNAGKP
jgi:hypothetical protein